MNIALVVARCCRTARILRCPSTFKGNHTLGCPTLTVDRVAPPSATPALALLRHNQNLRKDRLQFPQKPAYHCGSGHLPAGKRQRIVGGAVSLDTPCPQRLLAVGSPHGFRRLMQWGALPHFAAGHDGATALRQGGLRRISTRIDSAIAKNRRILTRASLPDSQWVPPTIP